MVAKRSTIPTNKITSRHLSRYIAKVGLNGVVHSDFLVKDGERVGRRNPLTKEKITDDIQFKGSCYEFDSSTYFSNNPDNNTPALDTFIQDKDFSISFEVKRSSTTDFEVVMSNSAGASENFQIALINGSIRFILFKTTSYTEIRASNIVCDGKWHKILCTVRTSDDLGRIFIDEKEATYSEQSYSNQYDVAFNATTAKTWLFGRYQVGSSLYNFNGRLANIRFYDSIIEAKDVLNPKVPSLVWLTGEEKGAIIYDVNEGSTWESTLSSIGVYDSDVSYSHLNEKGYSTFSSKYYSFTSAQKAFYPANPLWDWGTGNFKIRIVFRVPLTGGYNTVFTNSFASSKSIWIGVWNERVRILYGSSGTPIADTVKDTVVPNQWCELIVERTAPTVLSVTLNGNNQVNTLTGYETTEIGDSTYELSLAGDLINNQAADISLLEIWKGVENTPILASYFEQTNSSGIRDLKNNNYAPVSNYDAGRIKDYGPSIGKPEMFEDVGTAVIPASLSNPSQDVIGQPLKYQGKTAPRAQLVGAPCLTLNGTDQVVSGVANAAFNNINEGTILIVAKGGLYAGANASASSRFHIFASTTYVSFTFQNGGGSGFQHDITVPQDEWVTYALTFKEALLSGYMQGEFLDSKTVHSETNATDHVPFVGGILGTYVAPASQTAYFAILTEALTADEIKNFHATKHLPTRFDNNPTLKATEWVFTGGADTIEDKSGNGKDGQLSNAVLSENWANTQDVFHYNFHKNQKSGNGLSSDSAIYIADIPQNDPSVRGKIFSEFDLTNTTRKCLTSFNPKSGVVITDSETTINERARLGLLKGNYLDSRLGAELGYHFDLFKRYENYTGILATLRRQSDGATYNLTYKENGVDWTDPALLVFIDGEEVKAKRLYNTMPLANRIIEYIEAPDGQGATIYENGAWNLHTNSECVCFDFNGTDEYYEATLSPAISQQNSYQGNVAEYKGSGNDYAQNITHSAFKTPWLLMGARPGGTYRNDAVTSGVYGGNRDANNPSVNGYQELGLSRVSSENGVDVATVETSVNFSNGMNRFYLGRLRGNEVLCGSIKLSATWFFLDPKIVSKLEIEKIINADYNY